MSEQPEALRLADALDGFSVTESAAADELRRLHKFEVAYGVMMKQAESRIADLASDPAIAPAEWWQGLTDEELDAMRQSANLNFVTLREFRIVARAVETKLKERNG